MCVPGAFNVVTKARTTLESSWSSTTLEHSGSPTLTLAARTHLWVQVVEVVVNLMNTQGGLVVLCQVHSAVLAQTRFEWSAYISNIFLNIYIYTYIQTRSWVICIQIYTIVWDKNIQGGQCWVDLRRMLEYIEYNLYSALEDNPSLCSVCICPREPPTQMIIDLQSIIASCIHLLMIITRWSSIVIGSIHWKMITLSGFLNLSIIPLVSDHGFNIPSQVLFSTFSYLCSTLQSGSLACVKQSIWDQFVEGKR